MADISTQFINLEYRLKFWAKHPLPQQASGFQECLDDLRRIRENVLKDKEMNFGDFSNYASKHGWRITKEASKKQLTESFLAALDEEIKSPQSIVNEKKEQVDHPAHYQGDGLEVIEVLRAFLTQEQLIGFLRANIIKYLLRAFDKHESPVEDLKKAGWYLDYLLNELEGNHE